MNPNCIIILADERDNIHDHAAKLGDLEFITKVMENKLLISFIDDKVHYTNAKGDKSFSAHSSDFV